MKRTFAILRKTANLKDSAEARESGFVGTWIMAQLKHHIATGIMELEADIFDELDRLLYGPDGIGKRNPIATWVCLWALLLTYKEQMAFIYFRYCDDLARGLQYLHSKPDSTDSDQNNNPSTAVRSTYTIHSLQSMLLYTRQLPLSLSIGGRKRSRWRCLVETLSSSDYFATSKRRCTGSVSLLFLTWARKNPSNYL